MRVRSSANGRWNKKAIPVAEKLNLVESNYYQELLGYLYSDTDSTKAIEHYEQAIKLTKSKSEKQILTKEIKRLKEECRK